MVKVTRTDAPLFRALLLSEKIVIGEHLLIQEIPNTPPHSKFLTAINPRFEFGRTSTVKTFTETETGWIVETTSGSQYILTIQR